MTPFAGIFAVIGIIAVYLRSAFQTTIYGLVSFGIYLLSQLMQLSVGSQFYNTLPFLAAQNYSLVSKSFTDNLGLFGLGSGVLATVGGIMWGISLIRANIYPRELGYAFVIGSGLTFNTSAGTGFVTTLFGFVSTLLIYGALIGFGLHLATHPSNSTTTDMLHPT